jgi:cardiolipin-specific phospholipase
MSNIKPFNGLLKIIQFNKIIQKFADVSKVNTYAPQVSKIKPTDQEIQDLIDIDRSDVLKSGSYKRSTPPIAIPLSRILRDKLFPLSVAQSFQDYKYCKDMDRVQDELLSLLPFHNSNVKDTEFGFERESQTLKIDIGGGNYINEFFIRPKNDIPYEKLNHFVLVHGYGAGLGFFLKNFNELSSRQNWAIHSIDLLGYGCSSRPKIDFKKHTIESFFIDSLEKWRLKRNLNNILMCSHSLGAYFSLLFINKYPNVVKKLLLVSPAGIIKPKEALKNVPIWFEYLWDQRVSPFSLVRNSGPFGSLLTSGWSFRRFSRLSKEEKESLHRYTYGIFNSDGSGEYFLNEILAVGGVPRNALVDRAKDLINCDTCWIYGDDDWMPKEGGLKVKETVKDYKVDFKVISDSGHHLYLDNYKGFNELCLNEMKSFERDYST